jgi:hypothetical protein
MKRRPWIEPPLYYCANALCQKPARGSLAFGHFGEAVRVMPAGWLVCGAVDVCGPACAVAYDAAHPVE